MKIQHHLLFVFCAIIGTFLILRTQNEAKLISFSDADLTISSDSSYLYTPGMLLSEGAYIVAIEYTTSVDCRIDIYGDYNATYIDTLSAFSNQYFKNISLTDDAQGAKIRFTLPADGSLTIHSIAILSEKPIYRDAIYFAILYLLILFSIWLIVYKKWYLTWKRRDVLIYGCLAGLALIASIPQLRTALIDGIDLGGQLIRLEGVKDSLLEGHFPTILFPRTVHEYGELGCLYPYLFLYPLALLRICNVSLTTVFSTACVITNIVCVLLTYTAYKSITKCEYSALLATVIFMFLPFRIFTLTGSLFGTGFAMTFLAIALAGIYQIFFGDTKKWWYLTLGLTGIFQSHLLSTLTFLFMAILIAICFIKKVIVQKRFLSLLTAAFAFIMINLWYIIPFLHYYTTESLGISTCGDMIFICYFPQVLTTQIDYLLSVLFISAGIYYLIRYHKNRDGYYTFLVCLTAINFLLLIMITSIFPWDWIMQFPIGQYLGSTLQFTRRFFALTGLIGSLLLAVMLSKTVKNRTAKKVSIVLILFVLLLSNKNNLLPYLWSDNVLLTQKIGDIQPYFQREYLPPDTENEYFASNACTLSHETGIYAENYLKHGSDVTFSYSTELTDAYVEVPMFYYNDYKAQLEDGTPIELVDGTHHRIRIMLPKTDIMRTVTVSFVASPLYKVWVLVSLLSTGILIYYIISVKKKDSVKSN